MFLIWSTFIYYSLLRILRMPSRHSQDASSRMLPPLPNVPPGTSVLRGLAILTAVGLFIVWYWLILYCLVASVLPHFLHFWFYRLRRAFLIITCISIFLQPWFCPAALAANAAAFGRSLRWVFQGFPTSEKKKVQKNANLVDLENPEKWMRLFSRL